MTEKRFENRLDKSNVKFNTLNPVWDNEKETGLNVFEMIDELNKLSDENEGLKERNKRQYNRLTKVWELVEAKDWETLTAMNDKMVDDEKKLQEEWGSYYD